MTLLVAGIIIFILAHLPRRMMPEFWAGIVGRYGLTAVRAVFGLVIGIATLMIIVGFRSSPFIAVYDPPSWTVHLNNLMMLVAVFIFGLSMSKGRSRAWLRHPMMTAVLIWAAAHLLVNGDLASIILFVGMAVWALITITLINRAEPVWDRPAAGTIAGDIRLVVITLVAFGIITGIHTWLGYWPFPR